MKATVTFLLSGCVECDIRLGRGGIIFTRPRSSSLSSILGFLASADVSLPGWKSRFDLKIRRRS